MFSPGLCSLGFRRLSSRSFWYFLSSLSAGEAEAWPLSAQWRIKTCGLDAAAAGGDGRGGRRRRGLSKGLGTDPGDPLWARTL